MNDSPENPRSPSTQLLRVGNIVGGRYRVEALLGARRHGRGLRGHTPAHAARRSAQILEADPSELPAQRERFLGEARTAAAVRHPNIVDILDMGTHHDAPFLVMELLEGSTLDPVLADRRPISYTDCLSWMLPIIGALATLHDAGIVHRDVKPSNIFLCRAAPHQIVPKLLDFGLARALGDARLTRSGVVIGTPLYMAPEHAAGAEVGPAADVWSMGVVLFECLTGALPYSSTDRAVVAAQVLAGHVRPVRQVRPELPEPLAEAIDGALQRDLGRRHASMRALARALVGAAIASGLTLPEQLAPLGLPDFARWRGDAERRTLERPVAATHEVSAALTTTSQARPAPRRLRSLVLPLLTLLLALAAWLLLRPVEATRDRLAPKEPLAPGPAADVAPAPPSPTVQEVAPAAHEPAALEVKRPQSAQKAGPPEARRSPAPEAPRRKAKARVTEPPAEVETEWK